MRHPGSTKTHTTTRRTRVRLPLATIEELDHLGGLHHLTRQDVLRRLLAAALSSDSPFSLVEASHIRAHAELTRLRSAELDVTGSRS